MPRSAASRPVASPTSTESHVAAEPAAPAEPGVATEYYEIQSGETLSAIAKRYYGKASAYTKILEENREIIKDPNKIYPGQKIRIPAA